MSKLQRHYLDICSLSVFSGIKEKPLFKQFMNIFSSNEADKMISAYSEMINTVYKNGGSLTAAVRKVLFEDENVYVRAKAKGEEVCDVIRTSFYREIGVLQNFANLTVRDFEEHICFPRLAPFITEKSDLLSEFDNRLAEIQKHGYGIFASYPMFRLDECGEIVPVISFDKVALNEFVGYDDERASVVENTKAFLLGKPALNALLYGDAGTGKSSTVKALVNHFYSDGLRLIEIRKNQLSSLPYIMGRISENPLKFIIFIDDLSFNKNDDNFSMLKAALEGSASVNAENSLIYATSNRRHIVRETFEDRESDVHRNDTVQEKLSLSDRFGLAVLFGKPSKQLYLEIVHNLAERYGISMDLSYLDIKAEEFALRRGNRSPRCAEQFIKSLI